MPRQVLALVVFTVLWLALIDWLLANGWLVFVP